MEEVTPKLGIQRCYIGIKALLIWGLRRLMQLFGEQGALMIIILAHYHVGKFASDKAQKFRNNMQK